MVIAAALWSVGRSGEPRVDGEGAAAAPGASDAAPSTGQPDASHRQPAAAGDGAGSAPAAPEADAAAADGRDPRPAGERLRPGKVPVLGREYQARTRTGAPAGGWADPSSSPVAPVLVFVGESGADREAWRPTLDALRTSRDYHLLVVRAPTLAAEGAATVEATALVSHLEAGVEWALRSWKSSGVVLVGAGAGAAAAVLLAGARRDVLAVVAVSPPARLGSFRVASALDPLRGRHSRWIAAADDERSAATLSLAKELPLAAVSVRPGAARGVALLAEDRRARTSLAGWLFAVTPTVP